jgi:hypothetical protein
VGKVSFFFHKYFIQNKKMMQQLLLQSGELLHIKSTSLPLGKFVKIQPQSTDFLDITDPKAVLEQALRNFSTLTQGDIITIKYNHKLYDIQVLETKPEGKGISIVETDLEVDFAPPVGYVEPERSTFKKLDTVCISYLYQESINFVSHINNSLLVNFQLKNIKSMNQLVLKLLKEMVKSYQTKSKKSLLRLGNLLIK